MIAFERRRLRPQLARSYARALRGEEVLRAMRARERRIRGAGLMERGVGIGTRCRCCKLRYATRSDGRKSETREKKLSSS